MLLKLGCQLGQGYAIARPMPADQVVPWLEGWKTHEIWQNTVKLSRDDHALLFAAVEHRAWVSKLIHYLEGDLSIPPNLDKHQCQFGLWLDGHGMRRYADKPQLQQIISVHDAIHQFADMLVAKKWDHNDERLIEEIGLLKTNQKTLLALLNDLQQQKKS
jgi:hypothetical protein